MQLARTSSHVARRCNDNKDNITNSESDISVICDINRNAGGYRGWFLLLPLHGAAAMLSDQTDCGCSSYKVSKGR